MPITSWLGVLAALIFASFVSFIGTVIQVPEEQLESPRLGTIEAVPNPTQTQGEGNVLAEILNIPFSISSTSVESIASGTATILPQIKTESEPAPILPTVIPAPKVELFEATDTDTALNELDATIGIMRGALVNIICIPSDPALKSISGTGVIVHERGIILTVAHVAQYFLLKDYPKPGDTFCVIRAGSPAKNAYEASLIFLSPDWISENKTTIKETRPTGTGENDFALLAITESATSASLPRSFPFLPLAPANSSLVKGDPVAVGSYGAEFLDSSQIRSSLYPSIVFGTIKDVYTLDQITRATKDLFSINVGVAAQQGSSGGAATNEQNELIGLITNRTTRPDLSLRDLHVITADYIRRAFHASTGKNLDTYFESKSSRALVNDFVDEAKVLRSILINAID